MNFGWSLSLWGCLLDDNNQFVQNNLFTETNLCQVIQLVVQNLHLDKYDLFQEGYSDIWTKKYNKLASHLEFTSFLYSCLVWKCLPLLGIKKWIWLRKTRNLNTKNIFGNNACNHTAHFMFCSYLNNDACICMLHPMYK